MPAEDETLTVYVFSFLLSSEQNFTTRKQKQGIKEEIKEAKAMGWGENVALQDRWVLISLTSYVQIG